ncbi:MAG: alanine racemase [Candidatus Cloacimonetes bacterium]|nr:alanine racemase [Candidatus Cloacimonadota bacterium]
MAEMRSNKITKPTLLLDEDTCRKNIRKMYDKAQRNNVIFRPHFKTHQSLEIGNWFREIGVDKITVSSLEMAQYFSEEWSDITVAFPVNILEIDTINALAEMVSLNVLVESEEVVQFLAENLKNQVGFFIKIDVGYHRAGIPANDCMMINSIRECAEESDLLNFKGFLTHAGQMYNCRSQPEILKEYKSYTKQLFELKSRYPDALLSIGDTPSCSVVEDFSGIDEIRPGNFVFYDLMQYYIGSCSIDQVAVAMACPIVAIHKKRHEIVIYGGGVHFSKERLEHHEYGTIYGQIVENIGKRWGNIIPGMYVKNLSQEHGIVAVPEARISNYKIGDVLYILPVHSCLTANLMTEYVTTDGRVVERL